MNKIVNKFSVEMVGYTHKELLDASKQMIDEYKSTGKLPFENTTANDYMIIGDLIVYTPYIPLYTTDKLIKS